ncbi:MAG TPA: methyltransferase domain-containing protein [Planctomycetota bacterium]|jgi:ubiquinone/menaquinone biosynthesis C-methylase UbiE|nr:methyltransferase domain-containing protein [Planctomycetota bacterium]
MWPRALGAPFLFFLSSPAALAQESAPATAPASRPRNRDPHGPADVEGYIRVLEDPKRDAYQKPDEVVAALRLPPDATVADLGCGPGYFTARLARAVPRGIVYAVDVEPAQLDRLNEKSRKEGLENVVPVLATADDPRLPPGRIDLLFVCDTYHHFDDRPRYLQKLRRCLKEDGRLVVIDFFKRKLPVGPPPEHKMEREEELAEVEAAGFRLVEEPTFLDFHYFLVFEPGEAPPERPQAAWKVKPKVLALIYDPVIEARGGKRLHEVCGWNDPARLTAEVMGDLRRASGGMVQYEVVEWIALDRWPVKRDGFAYDDASFLACFEGKAKWHEPDGVDYARMFEEAGLVDKVNEGRVDEVFAWGAPYFGWWESTMAGPRAHWCNSEPTEEARLKRRFVFMGFNYERGVGEALESYGHRAESILAHVFGSWEPKETHAWNRFTLYDKVAPGKAAVGNVHFAPNSEADYDWGNKRPVESACDDWLSFPDLRGRRRRVSCEEWGGGDIRAHHRWWFDHLPRASGETDGVRNNWWSYVADVNAYD